MLNKKEIEKIKEHLEKAQNPLFFFDNDVDGLCSFIILQRAIGRGKGVAIKSFPELIESYSRKIDELNPDYIFILDKPRVSEDFLKKVIEKNLPIIWIDHHIIEEEFKPSKEIMGSIEYFNSSPSGEPTTYIAQRVFNRKEDYWLAILGCIGDNFLPDFAKEFAEENPEYFHMYKTAFDCLYKTELGKISMMINFGLKDTTTNVLNLIRLLSSAKNPTDILDENAKTKQLHDRYNSLLSYTETILKKTKKGEKLVLLEYSGHTSMSSELSNKLIFENKDKTVLVIFKKPDVANISIRGKGAKTILLKSIKDLPGAIGGGHEEASGGRIPIEELEQFKQNVFKLTN